jgi:hypothetical protein
VVDRGEIVTEAEIDTALDYLRSSALAAAVARSNVKHLEKFLKTKIAQLKKVYAGQGSNAAAEDWALAHPEYIELLDGYKVAVEQDAFHTYKREAADAAIRVWQTTRSDARAEGRAYG